MFNVALGDRWLGIKEKDMMLVLGLSCIGLSFSRALRTSWPDSAPAPLFALALLALWWWWRGWPITVTEFTGSGNIRVYVNSSKHGMNVLGHRASPGQQRDSEEVAVSRFLAECERSAKLEDALICYASRFFRKSPNAPAAEMVLNYTRYANKETKDADGRVHIEKSDEFLFCALRGDKSGEGKLGKWVSISNSGDFFMAVMPPNTPPAKKQKAGKGAGAVAPAPAAACLALKVHGPDAFGKLQRYLREVLKAFEPEVAEVEGDSTDERPLFSYTLSGWSERWMNSGSVVVPSVTKRPVYRDENRENYYRTYHESLFFPDKHKYFGQAYSLIDQFQACEGNYAVPGVQRKLNFLLYGPPGTGKSKFARALSMYTSRHLVSFSMQQITFEAQLLAMLDDPRQITDDPQHPSNYTYDDLLFVVEEIDIDGTRNICRRPPEVAQADDQGDIGRMETMADDRCSMASAGAAATGAAASAKNARRAGSTRAPLTLGFLLKTLDGGCDTPGRMLVMTTNRLDCLDPALRRPGRVKQLRLEFLRYGEFKEMVLHFRRKHGQVPCRELWTRSVDEGARMLLNDFQALEEQREGDLDSKQLGLSPALLEEKCMGSFHLQELFESLLDTLKAQWESARRNGPPPSEETLRPIKWSMISWQMTALYFVRQRLDDAAHSEVKRAWPLEERPDDAPSRWHTLAASMIRDEEHFNETLVKYVGQRTDADLCFRAQVEVSAADRLASALEERRDIDPISRIFAAFNEELTRKWDRPGNVEPPLPEMSAELGDRTSAALFAQMVGV